MSTNESVRTRAQGQPQSVSSDALDWGNQFSKVLEQEFVNAATELSSGANSTDFRRAMVRAVVEALLESGASGSEVAELLSHAVKHTRAAESGGEWTCTKNARRIALIDKMIQRTLSADEEVELSRLTAEMRLHLDTDEFVPLEGARQLHRHLLNLRDSGPLPN